MNNVVVRINYWNDLMEFLQTCRLAVAVCPPNRWQRRLSMTTKPTTKQRLKILLNDEPFSLRC
jgi:hypothetical protein